MTSKIDLSKSIPRDRWGEFFDQFTNGNRGRRISIEMIGSEFGNAELIKNTPLMAIVYDRPGKGDDVVIETGQDEVIYAHTVNSPTEVFTGQDSEGVIMAIQIADMAGTKTLIRLQSIQ
jgi:hypothetical protein